MTREGLEPSRHGGHGLLRAACLPFHHLANHEQWTVEGVEPSSAGCKPTVFPLDDTPRIEPVAPVGVEPAASAFSARRSHRLSYTGMNKRRRQESNLLDSRVAADRLAVRPRRHRESKAGGGTRTHLVRITRAVPGLSSIAGLH